MNDDSLPATVEGAFCRGLDLGGDASPGTDALVGCSTLVVRVLLSVPAVESHIVRRQMRIGTVSSTYTLATTTETMCPRKDLRWEGPVVPGVLRTRTRDRVSILRSCVLLRL